MASVAGSEIALLRLAGGLRWAGATRAAVVARSLTWGGAEAELVGARAGWQGYQGLSAGQVGGIMGKRLFFDVAAQGGVNYIGSKEQLLQDQLIDAALGINIIESGMAIYGLRPVGIGVGSALFQYSIKDGFVSPLNHRLTWQAFGAQAAVGTGFGYLGQGAEHLLTRRLAYKMAYHTALRLGPRAFYPLWLGAPHLFDKVVPITIGVTEEYLENKAQDQWLTPREQAARDSLQHLAP